MNGIFNINKPCDITSHNVVSKIRKLCDIRRVGHGGTLDPMATGVLPVLVGSAAAAQDYITDHDKAYKVGLRLGIITDTGDITGKTLSVSKNIVKKQELIDIFPLFTGEIEQIPPMYSAIKIDGTKLYELARQGKEIERPCRKVTIYSIEFIQQINDSDYIFEVCCSKGTYMRTLCEDIGKALGCGGTMFSLERRRVGIFNIKDSVTIEELEQLNVQNKLHERLISTEKIFSSLPAVYLSDFYSRLAKNGAEIYFERAKIPSEIFIENSLCRLYDQNKFFFALGEFSFFQKDRAVKAKVRFDTFRK